MNLIGLFFGLVHQVYTKSCNMVAWIIEHGIICIFLHMGIPDHSYDLWFVTVKTTAFRKNGKGTIDSGPLKQVCSKQCQRIFRNLLEEQTTIDYNVFSRVSINLHSA